MKKIRGKRPTACGRSRGRGLVWPLPETPGTFGGVFGHRFQRELRSTTTKLRVRPPATTAIRDRTEQHVLSVPYIYGKVDFGAIYLTIPRFRAIPTNFRPPQGAFPSRVYKAPREITERFRDSARFLRKNA